LEVVYSDKVDVIN